MDNLEIGVFKIRASAIGAIMTEPRGKSVKAQMEELRQAIAEATAKREATRPELKTYTNLGEKIAKLEAELEDLKPMENEPNLSQTCVSFLQDWVNERLYGRRLEFKSKYTDKGNMVEDGAILYASMFVDGMGLESKNLEHFEDEFITGTPDIVTGTEWLNDIKASWSHGTFPLYDKEVPTKDYWWQVMGYMGLTGKTKAKVIYVLMSMPEELISKEAKWQLGYNYTEEQYQEFADQYRYDNLPPWLRLKEFEVLFSEETYQDICNRVLECRAYIENHILPAIEANAKKYPE